HLKMIELLSAYPYFKQISTTMTKEHLNVDEFIKKWKKHFRKRHLKMIELLSAYPYFKQISTTMTKEHLNVDEFI
ncbi:hypothetical protein IFO25_09980, partial [Campylobacter coli]|nr:hypothetical protein [Campylobacter coli]